VDEYYNLPSLATHKITILGAPIAKKRPRFVRVGKGVRTYSAQDTEEGRFLWEILMQHNVPIFTKALRVDFEFIFSRPKSHFGTGRNANKLKPSAPKFFIKKPDYDNLEKFALDAMNNHVYTDDNLVAGGFTWKRYAKYGEHNKTVITIMELE